MDTMTRKDLTLQSLYFNHSQRISVVTGTSSVYGVLEETHLTSTHPFNIPKPGITLGNVQEKPWDGEATTSRSMGSNLYTRALRGAPLSVPTGNTHAPWPDDWL